MYKIYRIRDRIRVPPNLFSSELTKAVTESIRSSYINQLSSTYGLFIALVSVEEVGEGRIIPGDGAIYYDTVFEILSYRPELHEIVEGDVSEITEFGAFARIGPIDGLVHVSQVMDDFVSFSKTGSLQGKESKRGLKTKDRIRARVVAVSVKSLQTAKIGLTMRQMGLGKIDWIEEDKEKEEKSKKVKKDAK
jgi:DNA-directed RNA polymerase subunit E'